MLSIQAWRDISGCQMAPLTPLRSYAGGGHYFATVDGVMYAVQPENQKMIWRYEANDGGMAVQAPAVAEDNVFLATGNLGLLAESTYTGDLLVDLVINLFGINQRNSISLNQGTLHAVDRRTGQFKWMYETRMLGEPQVVGSRLCFGGLGVYGALDTGTGKEVWIHKDNDRGRDSNWYCLKAGPDGVLYGVVVPVRVEGAGTLKDRLRLEGRGQVRAVAIDAATGNVRWKTDLFDLRKPTRRPMATAVMSDGDGSLYIVCGQEVFVLEPTGRVRNHFTQKSAPFSERIAVSEGVIFLAGEGNTMVALDCTTGTPLWTFSKPRAPVVSPVAQDGMVYIGSLDANLYAVDEKTGRLVWRFECDRRISGRPLVEQGKLLVASDEGRIWRLRLPQP